MSEKLFFMITHGADHTEHVTIPFVMAVAALASDVEAVIGLQADAVEIAVKGRAETHRCRWLPAPFQAHERLQGTWRKDPRSAARA